MFLLYNKDYEPINYAQINDEIIENETEYYKNKNLKSVSKSNYQVINTYSICINYILNFI